MSAELLISVDRARGDLAGQLTRVLREAVRDGRLAADAPLPATRTLAAQLDVSRGVVVEAYARLTAEGYLVSRRGSGTRVAAHASGSGAEAGGPAATPDFALDLKPGTPDLSLFPRAAWLAATRRAFAAAGRDAFGYGDPAGQPRLRAELAGYLGRVRAAAAAPAQLVLVSGVAQSLSLLGPLLAARGRRRWAVEDPCSPGTMALLASHGVEIVGVPVDDEGLRVELLDALDVGVVLVTPAHQYPTGVVLSARRRALLTAWARRVDGYVLEDDYDAEFRYDREPVGCLQGLAPDRVVHLGSLSKSLAPGLRLGWAVLPAALAGGFREAKRYADLGTGAVEQLAFAELLAGGGYDRHLRSVRARYRSRRDALVAALARELPGASVRGVAAGLHLYLDLPGDDAGLEQAVVAEAAERRLRVEPVAPMRLNPGPPALTLGYSVMSEDRLRAAAAVLAQAVGAAIRERTGRPTSRAAAGRR